MGKSISKIKNCTTIQIDENSNEIQNNEKKVNTKIDKSVDTKDLVSLVDFKKIINLIIIYNKEINKENKIENKIEIKDENKIEIKDENKIEINEDEYKEENEEKIEYNEDDSNVKKYKQYENIIQMIQSPFSKDNELP